VLFDVTPQPPLFVGRRVPPDSFPKRTPHLHILFISPSSKLTPDIYHEGAIHYRQLNLADPPA